MKFEKLTVPSQRDLFITKMQEMILSGELAAHEKIPPERELAESMGISRTIVGTGIAVLESQGFLEVIPRQGTFVADFRKTANVATLNAIMRLKGDVLRDDDIKSILEIRWALEKLTIHNVMEKMTEDDLDRLYRTVERIRTSETPNEAAEHALEFQRQMANIGDNPMLALIIMTFRIPCVAMWIRFSRIYGIQTLYEHTLRSWELLREKDYRGALKWIETFSHEAIDGQYTLYEKDLKGK